MDNTELQEDEIIAALECCYGDDSVRLCSECPLVGVNVIDCKEFLGCNSLNLIYNLRGGH